MYEFLVYMNNTRREQRVGFNGRDESEARAACNDWLTDWDGDGEPIGHIVAMVGLWAIDA